MEGPLSPLSVARGPATAPSAWCPLSPGLWVLSSHGSLLSSGLAVLRGVLGLTPVEGEGAAGWAAGEKAAWLAAGELHGCWSWWCWT